jgi:hypothetical protein
VAAFDWLWHGFLARGNITLLTGPWKGGKTTLLSMLLARRHAGGTLAGLAVQPGKTIVVTEESTPIWAERARRHDFGGKACFIAQPFLHIPYPWEWQALLARIFDIHAESGADLVVLDPLAPLLPAENNPRSIINRLLPLTELTQRGIAILAQHHPGKGSPPIGQAARGSGALLGHVDISIEMRHPGGDPKTRRRRLLALSRHIETPRELLLELNAEATAYAVVSDAPTDPFQAHWDTLRAVLATASQKLTCDAILAAWPDGHDRPGEIALRRWLERAFERGLLLREGAGKRSDPWRYGLHEREEHWKAESRQEQL